MTARQLIFFDQIIEALGASLPNPFSEGIVTGQTCCTMDR
jgi:hypothetical protein